MSEAASGIEGNSIERYIRSANDVSGEERRNDDGYIGTALDGAFQPTAVSPSRTDGGGASTAAGLTPTGYDNDLPHAWGSTVEGLEHAVAQSNAEQPVAHSAPSHQFRASAGIAISVTEKPDARIVDIRQRAQMQKARGAKAVTAVHMIVQLPMSAQSAPQAEPLGAGHQPDSIYIQSDISTDVTEDNHDESVAVDSDMSGDAIADAQEEQILRDNPDLQA